MTGRLLSPGLVPAAGLVPSGSLVPFGPVYGGAPIGPHQIAMGIGASGALVDVSAWVEFGEGVDYTWGRTGQFDDTNPGMFTFTLNNGDGRFTPGNTASPLATTVVEGMAVTWLLGTRLVSGAILAVEFGTDEASWDLLKVTCDDMLGAAGRHALTHLADGLLLNSSPTLIWRLDETDGLAGKEANGNSLGPFQLTRTGANTADAVTFGIEQHPALPGTAVQLTAQPGETVYFGTNRGNTSLPVPALPAWSTYPADREGVQYFIGWWNFWVYPGSSVNLAVTYKFATVGGRWPILLKVTPTGLAIQGGTGGLVTVHTWTAAEMMSPQWVSLAVLRYYTQGQWWVYAYATVADVQVGAGVYYNDPPGNDARTWDWATDSQPVQVEFQVVNTSGTAPVSAVVQRVSSTLYGTGNEWRAFDTTEDGRRWVLDYISHEITSQAYPGTTLSTASIGYVDTDGRSVLDVYNDLQRTEQGHLFTTTSGTLTSATEVIQLRGRDRPTTVKAVFHVTDELDELPVFLRDISNLAASIQVTGPNDSVTVTDPTVTTTNRYLASGLSESVLNTDLGDLRMWGQDRLNRGKTAAVRTQSFTVDAANTPLDRSGDLLALVPGDRIQLAGLPAARLGMATWDGWLLGITETHAVGSNRFTIAVQPALDPPFTLDTGRVGNGGELNLATAMTATDVTMTLRGSGDLLSDAVPFTVRLGAAEHVQVTSVDSATGLTARVLRGVDGTTAVAQAVGNTIGVLTPAILGF